MSIKPIGIGVLAFSLTPLAAQVSGDRMRAYVKFLSSNELEGRGVGTRGGQLAEEYLAAQLQALGVQPGGEGRTFFQKVALTGVHTQASSELRITKGAEKIELRWQDEFVGATRRQQALTTFDGELVFVGHGIRAPNQRWNDYKTSVKGKVVVLFTNEPQPDNPKVFQGKALTYAGRWTYKYEEALRQGALGAIIVHTDATAGYSWEVVRNSWGKEDPQVKLKAGENALAFAGWVTRSAGEKLFQMAGRSVDELLAASDRAGFRPIPLGLRISGRMEAKIRELETRNVVGRLEGSDAARTRQPIIFSAHWDHLGVSTPVGGDSIYNGAIDNATGCAIVLELARAWKELTPKPKRPAIFLFVTAEESGLRGSQYYAEHPLAPPSTTALNVNFDAIAPASRRTGVVVTGAERTTAWSIVQQAAKGQSLRIEPDPRPEQGEFYRSDHFMLAKAGIPAFSVKMHGVYPDYVRDYHQPSDELRADWDFTSLVQAAEFGLDVARQVANAPALPRWRAGDEFARTAAVRKPRP